MDKATPVLPIIRCLACLLCWLPLAPACAWGHLGHRLTGEIATALLSPTAQQQVSQLLGDETLAEAATYMDREREALQTQWRYSARWHYDNIGVCDQSKSCPNGDCATQQLPRFLQLLANRNAPKAQRAQALRIVIHLVGDLHQPLHMADNDDRGGNNLPVRLYAGAERRSLHEVFDTELVKRIMGKARVAAFAKQLQQQYASSLTQWQRGTPTQWANESHELGARQVYGALPGFACTKGNNMITTTLTLNDAYLRDAQQLVSQQLTKAGVRLAALLNATLR